MVSCCNDSFSTMLPTLSLSASTWKVTCSMLESLIAGRTEYWQACNTTLASGALSKTGEPLGNVQMLNILTVQILRRSSRLAGIYCNGTFDTFVCWPHSSPGNVSVSCPSYLPWIREGNLTTKSTDVWGQGFINNYSIT